MRRINKKRLIFGALFILSLLVITFASLYVIKDFAGQKEQDNTILVASRTMITTTTGKEVSDSINKIINNVGNPRLSEKERYTELQKLSEYLWSVYSLYYKPEVRQFVNEDLNKYAKENFSKYYNNDDFNVSCNDPVCGEKIDDDLKNIIDQINNMDNIDSVYRNIVLKDIKTSAYIPNDDVSGKAMGVKLAVQLLYETGDANASSSATQLKNYFEKKFNYSLDL